MNAEDRGPDSRLSLNGLERLFALINPQRVLSGGEKLAEYVQELFSVAVQVEAQLSEQRGKPLHRQASKRHGGKPRHVSAAALRIAAKRCGAPVLIPSSQALGFCSHTLVPATCLPARTQAR